ncbi:MAG: M10 family metallopeptidase [Xenococcaceae cyanobacterium MO_188.B32]|nr:M10 family metallopeptidase [Xenococcaceae cyanobacterium MO_188.B32]
MKTLIEVSQLPNILDLSTENITAEINIDRGTPVTAGTVVLRRCNGDLHPSNIQSVTLARSIALHFLDSLELDYAELSNLDNTSRADNSIVTELAQIAVRSTTGADFTGNIYLDGILWGGNYWNTSASGQIKYSFWNSSTATFADDWTTAEKKAMVKALNTWAAVADITFVDAGDNNLNATLGFYNVDDSELDDSIGRFSPPGTSNEGIGYFNWQGTGWDYNNGNRQGDYGFVTMIHELGHSLGLAHPHDDGGGSSIYPGVSSAFGDTGNYSLNQGIYTTMSYNDGLTASGGDPGTLDYGYQGTPMAFDIAAIQHLYGANRNHNKGNNTYFLPTANASGTFYSSIWDTGGRDKISGSRASAGVDINLNDATLNIADGAGAGGYLSSVTGIFGGFTIANGVIIENADGSNFNDEIIGNEFNNNLFGDDGNDTLIGGSGNDTLIGDSGNDRLVGYAEGKEYDVLRGGTGVDTFVLGNSSNVFYRGNGYATIADFNWLSDYIEVKGTSSQYWLEFGNWTGTSADDTAIFYGEDAIGVVQDNIDVSITRDFLFV